MFDYAININYFAEPDCWYNDITFYSNNRQSAQVYRWVSIDEQTPEQLIEYFWPIYLERRKAYENIAP